MGVLQERRQVARVTPVILIGFCLSAATLLLFTLSGQRHIDRSLNHLSSTEVPALQELDHLHEALSSTLRAALLARTPDAGQPQRKGLDAATAELNQLVVDYDKMVEPGERADWDVLADNLFRYTSDLNAGEPASADGLFLRNRGLHQAVRVHSANKHQLELAELSTTSAAQHANARRTVLVLLLFAAICAVTLLRARYRERTDVDRENALIQRLEQTNADLNAFAGRIAHDLRSPLTPILTGSQMIQVAQVPDAVRDMAGRIAASARRLGSMIDALLLFSRTTGLRHDDAACHVATAASELRRSFADRVVAAEARLVVDVPDDLVVACEPELMQTLLQNLVENALKYGLEGSPDRLIRVHARTHGEHAVIAVEDHGPGVPAELIDRVFQPFVQAGQHQSGVGLGLAIVHRLAAARSGSVEVRPAEPRGSCFLLRLPLGRHAPRAPAEREWRRPSR